MKPNIIFFLIDGLRADQAYGNNRTCKTPNIDSLIQKGMYFEQAVASADGTAISLNTIFTANFQVGNSAKYQKLVLNQNNLLDVLKKNGVFIIIDRAHNNSTSDEEIERILNITYDEEFLKKNYRRLDEKLTRKENGEHEYRFYEWKEFFQKAGFELISNVIIKTKTKENLKLKNDDNIKEIFTEYELGAFGNRKIAYVLSPLKE